jgi:hypothetical protein
VSKPDWKGAPEWARFLAMDFYGEWWWFENEPELGNEVWLDLTGGRFEEASDSDPYWRESLERRP